MGEAMDRVLPSVGSQALMVAEMTADALTGASDLPLAWNSTASSESGGNNVAATIAVA